MEYAITDKCLIQEEAKKYVEQKAKFDDYEMLDEYDFLMEFVVDFIDQQNTYNYEIR